MQQILPLIVELYKTESFHILLSQKLQSLQSEIIVNKAINASAKESFSKQKSKNHTNRHHLTNTVHKKSSLSLAITNR